VLQHSEGSAPAQFALIAGPLILSFTAALAIPLLGFQKSQLTAAAATIAERVARADVTEGEVDSVAAQVLETLGLENAAASVESLEGVQTVRLSLMAMPGIELEAVGHAIDET
jgi:hypothetical protein